MSVLGRIVACSFNVKIATAAFKTILENKSQLLGLQK